MPNSQVQLRKPTLDKDLEKLTFTEQATNRIAKCNASFTDRNLAVEIKNGHIPGLTFRNSNIRHLFLLVKLSS